MQLIILVYGDYIKMYILRERDERNESIVWTERRRTRDDHRGA